jgi:hypothetical protein
MDAKTKLKHALPKRHATERFAPRPGSSGSAMALTRHSADAAVHRYASAEERGITFDHFDCVVHKRTLCAADLKPAGRYVAKDLFQSGDIPLPKTSRRQSRKTNKADFASSYPCKDAEQVGAASGGASARPGRAAETRCYVDI